MSKAARAPSRRPEGDIPAAFRPKRRSTHLNCPQRARALHQPFSLTPPIDSSLPCCRRCSFPCSLCNSQSSIRHPGFALHQQRGNPWLPCIGYLRGGLPKEGRELRNGFASFLPTLRSSFLSFLPVHYSPAIPRSSNTPICSLYIARKLHTPCFFCGRVGTA